jgi:hypothetical protein
VDSLAACCSLCSSESATAVASSAARLGPPCMIFDGLDCAPSAVPFARWFASTSSAVSNEREEDSLDLTWPKRVLFVEAVGRGGATRTAEKRTAGQHSDLCHKLACILPAHRPSTLSSIASSLTRSSSLIRFCIWAIWPIDSMATAKWPERLGLRSTLLPCRVARREELWKTPAGGEAAVRGVPGKGTQQRTRSVV